MLLHLLAEFQTSVALKLASLLVHNGIFHGHDHDDEEDYHDDEEDDDQCCAPKQKF